MKTILFAFVLWLAALSAGFAGQQDFKLVNKTGFDINEVYVSAHSKEDWESDVMGKGLLANDASVEIHFSPADKTKDWDLKVVDGKGKSIVWEKLNLLEISKVTLHYADGKATAEVE